MRKAICTSSIFCVILGLLISTFFIQVPDRYDFPNWIMDGPFESIPLIVWLVRSVFFPLAWIAIAAMILAMLWIASEKLCTFLRSKFS